MVISQNDREVASCRYGSVDANTLFICSIVIPFYESLFVNQQILSVHRLRKHWSLLFTSVYTLILPLVLYTAWAE